MHQAKEVGLIKRGTVRSTSRTRQDMVHVIFTLQLHILIFCKFDSLIILIWQFRIGAETQHNIFGAECHHHLATELHQRVVRYINCPQGKDIGHKLMTLQIPSNFKIVIWASQFLSRFFYAEDYLLLIKFTTEPSIIYFSTFEFG